ncbi:MAG: hypothetical protein ACRENE_26455 [Polyangiaceae bacterium]
MSEGLINLVDDDSSHDVHDAHGQDERLATTRFPPQSSVPPPGHASGRRPAAPAVGMVVPPARASDPAGASPLRGGLYPSEPPAPLPRTSWWRSLIASSVTQPSGPEASPSPEALQEESADRRVGKTCLGMAFGFALLALLVALRSSPGETPAVAVAIVTSRTLIALALIAFGYGVLRAGERFLR